MEQNNPCQLKGVTIQRSGVSWDPSRKKKQGFVTEAWERPGVTGEVAFTNWELSNLQKGSWRDGKA